MSVNERLYASKRLLEFDEAVRGKDCDKVRVILASVDMTKRDIEAVLRSLHMV